VAGKILTPSPDRKGYLRIEIAGVTRQLHAVICEAFNGPAQPGQLCRHLNDDRADNRPENLAWGSALDNAADARRNGRLPRRTIKIDKEQAVALRQEGWKLREIAEVFGVSHVAVCLALKSTKSAQKSVQLDMP
jgi:hypothetical protein